MSDDWQIGDLALCVQPIDEALYGARLTQNEPKVGGIYDVCDVYPYYADGEIVLEFGDIFDGCCDAISFRKIHPLTDEERRQVIEDLRIPECVA